MIHSLEDKKEPVAIFSEEYSKDTTGMASVCCEYLSLRPNTIFYLNHDHWIDYKWTKSKDLTNKIIRLGIKGFGYRIFGKNINQIHSGKIIYLIKLFRRIFNVISFPLDQLILLFQVVCLPRSLTWFVHIGGWPAGIRGRLLLLYLKLFRFKKINLIIHNEPIDIQIKFVIKIYSFVAIWCSDNIITVSEFTASKLRFFFPLIKVVNNGIRDRYCIYEDLIRKNALQKKSKLELLLISNFTELSTKKSCECLVELSKLSHIYNIKCVGPIDIEYIFSLIPSEKLYDNISFLGFSNHISELIINSDLVFIPSRCCESFSMVFLEASMLSRPCLCFDSIATSELLLNEISGWSVNLNKGSLYHKLYQISRFDRKEIMEFGIRARKLFLEKYTAESMVSNYESITKDHVSDH